LENIGVGGKIKLQWILKK